MATKSKKSKTTKNRIPVPGLSGVFIVKTNRGFKLELRSMLGMGRVIFGRLINVSERTIAGIETDPTKEVKLQRNYLEVKRLCDSLSEVVEPSCLGSWFNTPNEAFNQFKPIEVIERGEIDRLWEMFYRLRSGMPG
ncbi:MAG: hypothetical protein COA78_22560 [Blastopirellula sp.]|nr:MAG: hypothetical protein COA78_22560 [Blastopirellula sp.]